VTQISDNRAREDVETGEKNKMSEYYLADQRAEERAQTRDLEKNNKEKAPTQSQDIKVTLLGDFLFPSQESQGCDPYNSAHGKPVREAWKSRRDRR
jgi:hypothetical protein